MQQALKQLKEFHQLNKIHFYKTGYTSSAFVCENATKESYFELIEELRAEGGETLWLSENCGNSFAAISSGEGYTYACFYSTRRLLRAVYVPEGKLLPPVLSESMSYAGEKTLTQVCADDSEANFGMCYIFTLGEGHFLIYDGNGDKGNDEQKILKYLKAGTPEGVKPVVDAWIFTHPHWDHVSGAAKFARLYGNEIEVKNILKNTPPPSRFCVKDLPGILEYEGQMRTILDTWKDAKCYLLHTGQNFRVGDAEVEVLYTQEDCPADCVVYNDTSIVTRVRINGKRILFPADIQERYSCQLLRELWGHYLKSDWYQAAHHGWNSECLQFYDLVDPEVVLWPLRKRDRERIAAFPATKRMNEEIEEGKRKFYISVDDDYTLPL